MALVERRLWDGTVIIIHIADAMVTHGFRKVGYTYLNLDYCWSNSKRSQSKKLIPDRKAFPHGIKDAKTFADWGVDYLKYDNCNNTGVSAAMRDALKATKRPIYHSICNWGESEPHFWRTTTDIWSVWKGILYVLDQQRNITKFVGPGGWNDPDMLEIGNGKLTFDEQKSHFSLWAALKAPLLLGFDLRNPPKDTLAVALNKKIIAVN
ncbi:20884_t:CDS:10, partial [Dentiscutata erythropus]